MSDDDIHGLHGLAGAYAVDAVDDIERARFESHLAGCSACQHEVQSLRAAAGELSLASITAPPASLRTAVLRDISAIRPLPPVMDAPESPVSLDGRRTQRMERAQQTRRSPGRWLAGVAAAAVIATGGVLWHPWSGVPERGNAQLTATQQVLQAKDAQRFEQRVGGATATVVRSPSLNRAVIVTANLPAAPRGKVYEVWLQQGKTMVKAGFVPVGASHPVLLQGNAATAVGAGITIEPVGGSETPTLPPVALVSFA